MSNGCAHGVNQVAHEHDNKHERMKPTIMLAQPTHSDMVDNIIFQCITLHYYNLQHKFISHTALCQIYS